MTDEEVEQLVIAVPVATICYCPLKGKATCKAHAALLEFAKSVSRRVRADALKDAAEVAEAEYAEFGWHDYYQTAGRVIADRIRALSQGVDEGAK